MGAGLVEVARTAATVFAAQLIDPSDRSASLPVFHRIFQALPQLKLSLKIFSLHHSPHCFLRDLTERTVALPRFHLWKTFGLLHPLSISVRHLRPSKTMTFALLHRLSIVKIVARTFLVEERSLAEQRLEEQRLVVQRLTFRKKRPKDSRID